MARSLLPTYGGTSAVWTTALVFFQCVLLVGYAWAHVTSTRLALQRHVVAQIALVVIALVVLLPAALAVPSFAQAPASAPTALWLILVLTSIVGLPFLALSSASPTTQRWFAALPGGVEPYRLFAASNLGSLIGLVAYPTLIEPNMDLTDQARWWSIGFAVFVALTVAAAVVVRRKGRPLDVVWDVDEPGPTTPRRISWTLLAGIPAALLVGVTTDISTDIAAVPLLWVGPLVVYLGTLILAYARPTPIGARPAAVALIPLAFAVALRKLGVIAPPVGVSIALLLATLGAAGLALHGRLAADRPSPRYLTGYTLLVALGGALGGIAAGILAPLVFNVPLEGLLVLGAAVVLAAPTGWWRVLSVPAVVALGLAIVATIVGPPGTIRVDRSFYGAYRVTAPTPDLHVLYSGTTIHGRETFSGPYAGEPLSYYHRAGPLGEVIASLQQEYPTMRVGAVGLGAGAIAAYGRYGDSYTFFEIDPTVVSIARDPASFTFLADSAASVDVVVEDGRLGLESTPDAAFDLLVLDAFSSDAVPVHLLTVESMATAMRTVAPAGVIAVHISNRFLDLEPIVAAAAKANGFVSIIGSDFPAAELTGLADASQWVIVGRSYSDVADLVAGDRWRTAQVEGRRPWTDRYTDLIGAIRD
ncbi:MAG TPA: fused MFS/spermidine synthase [Candidatus Limnocylindrales bacterium]|nr:fused MFS/spermidine synthase [Candidatus Limnocylindrales bacterium]